jgi:hypothetical protein
VNQWLNPLKRGTGSNLVDVGRVAVRVFALPTSKTTPRPVSCAGEEATGKVCGVPDGEAAAEQLDVDPIDRNMVNVGTVSGSPSLASSQLAGGQAHRRLMAPGRGGGSVVVRGRESRLHGEGTQRTRSKGTGMPGGRR